VCAGFQRRLGISKGVTITRAHPSATLAGFLVGWLVAWDFARTAFVTVLQYAPHDRWTGSLRGLAKSIPD
jgi:hypothetical protein